MLLFLSYKIWSWIFKNLRPFFEHEEKVHVTNPNDQLFDSEEYKFTPNELNYFKFWSKNIILEQMAERHNMPKFYKNRENNPFKIGNLSSDCAAQNYLAADTFGHYLLHEFKLVSSENDHFAEKVNHDLYFSGPDKNSVNICSGYLVKVGKSSLTVALSRDIRRVLRKLSGPYYLDFIETFAYSTITTDQALGNLVNLFDPTHKNLRSLLVDDHFDNSQQSILTKIPENAELNEYQNLALKKSIQASKFHLIMGLPGTGKTKTITEIIKFAVSLGASVIISSFTNSAVDNVLMKLLDAAEGSENSKTKKLKILRLGRKKAIHQNLLKYSEDELTKSFKTPEELEEFYKGVNVVGATVIGADHPLLFLGGF